MRQHRNHMIQTEVRGRRGEGYSLIAGLLVLGLCVLAELMTHGCGLLLRVLANLGVCCTSMGVVCSHSYMYISACVTIVHISMVEI